MALASVTLEGFDQVQLRLELMSRALRKNIIRGGVRATLAVFRSGVRGRTPRKTGTLWRSIGTSTRVLAGGAEVDGKVRIGNRVRGGGRRGATGAARGAFYGHMLEGGAKPHEIRPKTAKALRIGGRFVSRVLKHPGVRPMRMWAITRAVDEPAAQRAFRQYVDARIAAIWASPTVTKV